MIEFFHALFDPNSSFLRLALAAGTLASISFGIMGTYVVTRRIGYLAGAIAHCVFGGIGAALYLKHRWGVTWLDPMAGALVSAIVAAVLIGLVSIKAGEREDSIIGALWAVGMASGLIFIDLTPGYFELSSYLFGDILLISHQDVLMVAGLDLVIILLAVMFHPTFLSICFDEEFATLRGINTPFFYILLLVMTAVTVVLLVRLVGVIMVIAMLTLPAAAASTLSRRLSVIMVLATGFALLFNWSGLALSYTLDLSAGPVIISVAGLVYLGLLALSRVLPNR
ncbi:metal ABC transporter permease [Desulfoluna butyratoxydans]|uniref:Abc transporter trocd-like n=1 Tax=Desulfoluna butyratoxydans TaxID=231438 RepID=A0A4V6IKT5_9BACT|nr:metal ABC transporter permease [Desulfoluna butyratoxydans]VFQ42458.1 abc transporter trocd-like [Desulfoluna butyratoxydans]